MREGCRMVGLLRGRVPLVEGGVQWGRGKVVIAGEGGVGWGEGN